MERVFREASSEPVLADFLQVLRTVEEQLALGYRKGEGAARVTFRSGTSTRV